ncbi:MAG: T9SS type A sorting domain-containing protein [Bacteroidota bacterium]
MRTHLHYSNTLPIMGIIIALCSLVISSGLNAQETDWRQEVKKNNPQNFFEIQKAFNDYWKDKTPQKGTGVKPFQRWLWYWESRVDKQGNFPPASITWNEWAKYEALQDLKSSAASSGNWAYAGPDSANGGYYGMGRVNCIVFHPTNKDIFWIGTASGGVWQTVNFGKTWTTTYGNQPVLGVSDMVASNTDPVVLYVATGDGDRGSGCDVNNTSKGDTKSIGVLKSVDGGQNWKTTGLNFLVSEQKLIGRIVMNSLNSKTLLVAASDGIHKTTDGGTSWINKKPGFNFLDIIYKPGDTLTLYAATYDPTESGSAQVYNSRDGGETWDVKTTFSKILRIGLAVSNAAPNRVEAACVNKKEGLQGLYRSDYSGDSFSPYYLVDTNCTKNLLNSKMIPDNTCKGQGEYDLAFAINPANASEIYLGGVNTWKSITEGQTWNLANYWTDYKNPSIPVVHADKHYLKYHPLVPGCLFEANDGGVFYTTNGGAKWNEITRGLPISQIYRIGVSQSTSSQVICGLQDNGSREKYSNGWGEVSGGDGMECIIDYSNNKIQYCTYTYGEIYRSLTGSWETYDTISKNIPGGQQEGAWVTPYVLNPKNPKSIYAGYYKVYKSMNRGNSWAAISDSIQGKNTIRSIAVAPSDTMSIYVATFTKIVHSKNGGQSWDTITAGLPSGSNITFIAVDPANADNVYVSLSPYIAGQKVYKSINAGQIWTNISGTLPNLPVNCIIYEKGSKEGLYVGTDVGVFYKNANLSDWVPFNNGLPNVMITDLEIFEEGKTLYAGTFGRGLWQSDVYRPAGIAEQQSSGLRLFPNPSDGNFTLEFIKPEQNKIVALEIFSIDGRQIWRRDNLSTGQYQISIPQLSSGVYQMKVILSDKTVTNFKMIISH